jgi:hypothetical protein
MNFFMLIYLPWIKESSFTNITLIWLLSCVNIFMVLQIMWSGKSLLTNITLIWLLACVKSLMSFQITCFSEALLTHVTHRSLRSGVSFLMFHQVALAPESQLTTLAHMFPYLIVPVHVSYPVRRACVRFPAARYVTHVDTECELILQESSKFMCIRKSVISVRLHNCVFRERCTNYY